MVDNPIYKSYNMVRKRSGKNANVDQFWINMKNSTNFIIEFLNQFNYDILNVNKYTIMPFFKYKIEKPKEICYIKIK